MPLQLHQHLTFFRKPPVQQSQIPEGTLQLFQRWNLIYFYKNIIENMNPSLTHLLKLNVIRSANQSAKQLNKSYVYKGGIP